MKFSDLEIGTIFRFEESPAHSIWEKISPVSVKSKIGIGFETDITSTYDLACEVEIISSAAKKIIKEED